MNLSAYKKFLVAASAAVIAIAVGLPDALADDVLSVPEIITLVLAVLSALGVYAVRNEPKNPDLQ